MKNTEWVAPIFVVIAIFAIWLSLEYLPLAEWGITIQSDYLWLFMPWLVVFAVGLFALKVVYRRR